MVKQLHTARKVIFYLVEWLELIISVLALAGIAAHLIGVPSFWAIFHVDGLSDYLKYLFDALIGIELIKLLCRNDLYSMIEVLLFAVTRHLIIQHVATWEILIGIAAIAVLFAIRRFRFIHPETYEKEQRRREYFE